MRLQSACIGLKPTLSKLPYYNNQFVYLTYAYILVNKHKIDNDISKNINKTKWM